MSENSKSPEDRRLRFILAQTMWRIQLGHDLPSDAEERKAAWEQAKVDEIQKSARMIRMLDNRGVTLSVKEDADASEAP